MAMGRSECNEIVQVPPAILGARPTIPIFGNPCVVCCTPKRDRAWSWLGLRLGLHVGLVSVRVRVRVKLGTNETTQVSFFHEIQS